MKRKHIYPNFDRLVSQAQREERLQQRSCVLWLTGLSGAGKSSIAQYVENHLFEQQFFAKVLDGDNMRTGINSNLGFSMEDRKENIRRMAETAKLLARTGIIPICSAISPTQEIRAFAREILQPAPFVLAFIDTPLAVCEQRDPKGLYKKARSGEVLNFTGIDSPYEPPTSADIHLLPAQHDVAHCAMQIYDFLLPLIKKQSK